VSPPVTSAILIGLGLLGCLLLARLGGGRRILLFLLLGSYSLRVAVAIGLYVVSAYDLPILTALHAPTPVIPQGFWHFTYDAPAYHENGVRIAAALHVGAQLPRIIVHGAFYGAESIDFFYAVGYAYWVLGSHPVYVPLVNAMLWTGTAFLGYLLSRRLRGERSGWLAAGLIGFWPSGLIWSGQILKDTAMLFLLLLSVWGAALVLEGRLRAAVPAGLVLGPAVFELTRVRAYSAGALVVAVLVSLLIFAVRRRRTLSREWIFRAAILATLLVAVHVAARVTLAPVAVYVPGAPRPPQVRALPGSLEALSLALIASVARVMPRLSSGLMDLHHTLFHLPELVTFRRVAFLSYGGGSIFATDARFRTLWDVLVFVPTGVAHALYAPFPWEWLLPGATGVFKALSGVETFFIVVLTPFLILGVWKGLREGRLEASVLVLTGLILLVALSVTVPNVGTLFRLRLQPLVPLLVVMSAYGLGEGRLGRRISGRGEANSA
jgi:4-amino-4-deoxy-L-arabinose transferase-like glycosyltransferase